MTETWRERERRWQAETLRAAHGRAPEQQPRFSTISDLEIDRLYSPLDWHGEAAGGGGPTAVDHLGDPLRRGAAGPWAAFDPLRDIGFPGEPPFTRGVHPTGYRTRLWTMRMFAGFGAAEDTN